MNYLVVLFKNKKRKKIIKSFIRKNKAENFFKDCLEDSDSVKFNVVVENATKTDYEIALLSCIDETQLQMFKQDDLGRNVKIELSDSDYKIIKIEKFNLPEKIYDWSENKRVDFDFIIQKYFKEKTLKNIFTINNKLIIQVDENINLFSLKNSSESHRLLDTLQEYMVSQKRMDSIFVKDLDNIQRKYLYSILEKNGIDKKKLYRQTTTFSKRK